MAGLYRVQMGVIQRSKGQSALEKSAYQRRTSTPDGSKDWSKKAEDLVGGGVLLPPGAKGYYRNPEVLWKTAEQAEKRCDAQLARAFEISIPDEVPREKWKEFTEELMEFFIERGFAVEYMIHEADGKNRAEKNPHFHALVTMRHVSEIGFADKKDLGFNQTMRSEDGHFFRRTMAEKMNDFFDKNGIDLRVSHEKKEDRLKVLPRARPSVLHEIKRVRDARIECRKRGGDPNEEGLFVSKDAQEFLLDYREQKANIFELNELERRLEAALERVRVASQEPPAPEAEEETGTDFDPIAPSEKLDANEEEFSIPTRNGPPVALG